MALEAVVFAQTQDPFGGFSGSVKELYNSNYNLLCGSVYEQQKEEEEQECMRMTNFVDNQTENYPYGDWSTTSSTATTSLLPDLQQTNDTPIRPKRRRPKTRKNKEEIENQRMTHIAVERNRRKQMNEYLSVLRSLMPDSYIQRGDQASIIGGAINFVKELEQRLQFLGAQKEVEPKSEVVATNMPFSEFFTFPQYSTSVAAAAASDSSADHVSEVQSGIADIEVTMVESHANLKIRSKKRPKQLLKLVSGLHTLRLTILHLNVTTTAEIVLYSLSVKVEDDCKLGSVDDIASAVYQMLDRIQQEAMVN
ncbi:hypothetical protein VNO77_13582 [Canavalia gladiata]|uniref:BHLH domain-containing protein n=1 Tax=Canavalia gladiata TaxID=3824 RepID=A0AAN9LY15_CANGL